MKGYTRYLNFARFLWKTNNSDISANYARDPGRERQQWENHYPGSFCQTIARILKRVELN
ncbi:hypothetical protein D1AOALGA4SA_1050 [Olavius algarvensis Delta 1 endosymbiont]|nr:hypothetical protein D1AOALGA4SA_1050 [Olavius algarvensis Delta 1 endosymbiont]